MKNKLLLFIIFVFCFAALESQSFAQTEPLDGRGRTFRDELLDNLVGNWKLTRKIRGQTVENKVKAEWVLNHQFLRIEMKDVKTPVEYEATIFIGYDNMSERYVVHWLDVFGGRFSETLAYGTKTDKNSIKFVFEYPDSPFHNIFTWNGEAKTWQFLMRTKDNSGKWTVFAEDTLRK